MIARLIYASLGCIFLFQHLAGVRAGYVNFNDVCQKIWQEDRNRVSLGRDYRVNIQNRIYDTSSNIDRAYSRLFSYVDRNILTRPTFKTFLALLNNYERFVGTTEDMNSREKRETWDFLRAISLTGPVKELHNYLVVRKLAPTSMDSFLRELFKMWFYRYQRKSYRDSSGFEHVFVGEISRGAVTGFHNWLQFYHLERTNQIDYRGYIKYYSTSPRRLKLQFYWGNYKKLVTSFFLGTSPEFDIAVYTLCFLVNPGKSCRCRMNNFQDIPIVTYPKGSTTSLMIASAYLKI